jgi:hypothetical protein
MRFREVAALRQQPVQQIVGLGKDHHVFHVSFLYYAYLDTLDWLDPKGLKDL